MRLHSDYYSISTNVTRNSLLTLKKKQLELAEAMVRHMYGGNNKNKNLQ